ncbi:MAG: helix-turn-helix domain-containing protein [Holophagales bacterium]|nr:helix-turn-helix domain-containing protein [Holophagales bacterium]
MCNQILLSQKEVAKILGLSPETIRDWRWMRIGPPFQAISRRCVRYDQAKLLEWIEKRTVNPIPDFQLA